MISVVDLLYASIGGMVGIVCLGWCCRHYFCPNRTQAEIVAFNNYNMANPSIRLQINNSSNRRRLIRYLQMNPDIIPRLAREPYTFSENTDPEKECIICMDLIGDIECTLNCGHSYHYECIKEWAYTRGNNSCPQCRGAVIDYQV